MSALISSRLEGRKPTSGKNTQKYPIKDMRGQVRLIPAWLAEVCIEAYQIALDEGIWGNDEKLEKRFKHTKWAKLGFQNLSESEFQAYKSGSVKFQPVAAAEFESLKHADAQKSEEIERLKAMIEAMKKGSQDGVKKPEAKEPQLQLTNEGGGK